MVPLSSSSKFSFSARITACKFDVIAGAELLRDGNQYDVEPLTPGQLESRGRKLAYLENTSNQISRSVKRQQLVQSFQNIFLQKEHGARTLGRILLYLVGNRIFTFHKNHKAI